MTGSNLNTSLERTRDEKNTQRAYANKKLQAQGYLFLNDVLEMLGIQKTKASQN